MTNKYITLKDENEIYLPPTTLYSTKNNLRQKSGWKNVNQSNE